MLPPVTHPAAATTAHGLVTGYASLFGRKDQARDIVEAGAFRAALRRRSPRQIRMLWQHDPGCPIGVWHSLVEDAKGLRVSGQLALATRQGREAAALIAAGALDGLSIGFRTIRARPDRHSGCRHLMEVDLWEISIVTFPALPEARIARPAPDPITERLRHATQLLRP